MEITARPNSNSDFFPRRSSRPEKARKPEKARDPYDGLRFYSALTHGVGAVLALFGTALLLFRAISAGKDLWHIISFLIYGISMIVLYTASTLYHSVNTGISGRIALRKCDHISIYYLIAGTYTPLCLIPLRGAWGWTLFGIIWGLAIAGTVLTLLWLDCPRKLTSGIYIAMGWIAVVALYPIRQSMGASGLFRLLLGGVFYTIGGVLYALKCPGRDNPRFGCHEIFHVFVLLGSLAHYWMIDGLI